MLHDVVPSGPCAPSDVGSKPKASKFFENEERWPLPIDTLTNENEAELGVVLVSQLPFGDFRSCHFRRYHSTRQYGQDATYKVKEIAGICVHTHTYATPSI